MAKKKTSSGNAETPKSASKKAKRAPLSNSAIRFVGFLVAFIGIMLIISGNSIVSTILEVVSVFLILWGLFLVSGNAKRINDTSTDKNKVYLNLLLGILMIVCGILLIFFRGQLQNYFILIVGCAIGAYGLLMFIKFLCSPRTRKSVFNIVMGVLTIITGILICLLYVPQISSAGNGVCYIVFGAFATAVGCLEIICY